MDFQTMNNKINYDGIKIEDGVKTSIALKLMDILFNKRIKLDMEFKTSYIYRIPNITMEMIEKLDFNWCYETPYGRTRLSNNKNITLDYIKQNLDKNWDWFQINDNNPFTIEEIKANPDLKWFHVFNDTTMLHIIEKDYGNRTEDIPGYRHSTVKDIDRYVRTYDILYNVNIDEVRKNAHTYTKMEWEMVSINKNITMEHVTNNLDLEWSRDGISQNPNITMDFVKNPKHKHLINPSYLVGNDAFSFDELRELWKTYPEQDIDLFNNSIPLDYYEKYIFNDLKYEIYIDYLISHLLERKDITIDFIRKYITLGDRNGVGLCGKPFIKMEYLENELKFLFKDKIHREYIFTYISENPNLTFDYLLKNKDETWCLYKLCSNSFTYEYTLNYERKIKKYLFEIIHCLNDNLYKEKQIILKLVMDYIV